MISDIQLHFVNVNFLVDYPRLLAPNTRYVGGFHLRKGLALEDPFKSFVEDAGKNGVILFSLGFTGFSSKDVPLEMIKVHTNTN